MNGGVGNFFADILAKILRYFYLYLQEAVVERENQFLMVRFIQDGFQLGKGESPVPILLCFAIPVLLVVYAADFFEVAFFSTRGKKKGDAAADADPASQGLTPEMALKLEKKRKKQEWKEGVNFLKVIIFAAAVFSLHGFYRSLVQVLGMWMHDEYSVFLAAALGSYLNPFSILLVSHCVCGAELKNVLPGRQAFCLAATVFVMPTVMLFGEYRMEAVTILVTGLLMSLTVALRYGTRRILPVYVMLSAEWLTGKFFMLNSSEEVRLLSGTVLQKLLQYLVCMKVDLMIVLVLLLAFAVYEAMVDDGWRKQVVWQAVCAVLCIGLGAGGLLIGQKAYAQAPETIGFLEKRIIVPEEAPAATVEEKKEPVYHEEDVVVVGAEASSYLTGKTGTVYEIGLTMDGDPATCWQDGTDGDGIGETLTYHFGEPVNLSTVLLSNGNRDTQERYEANNRIAVVGLYCRRSGVEVAEYEMTLENDFAVSTDRFDLPQAVSCDELIIEIREVYNGSKYQDTCLAEVSFRQQVED